jgi:hypothetical protein
MIKWPNDKMTKRRDRRSESAPSDSKAYGTTCRRQKTSLYRLKLIFRIRKIA